MKKLKYFTSTFLLVFVFTVFNMANFASAAVKSELVWGALKCGAVLDIQRTTSTEVPCFHMASTVFEPLIQFDFITHTLKPCLIEKMPEYSSDNRTYTFKLKKDVKFHDGTELTSKDIKFTLERVLKPSTKSFFA